MERENFVTYFDKNFIAQGLALYRSLERHVPKFRLWVVCLDKLTIDTLTKLNFEHLVILNLSDYETPALLRAKEERNKIEYYWTLTPFVPIFVFNQDPALVRLTYLDADMWLYGDVEPIFSEFKESRKSILITKHRFAPQYDASRTTGKFCVQLIIIERNGGIEVLNDWGQKCIKWCYNFYEDGKFGDQKYLEAWPSNFPEKIHILSNENNILAPWNVSCIPYSDATVIHFHGFKLYGRTKSKIYFSVGEYPISKNVFDALFVKYVEELNNTIDCLERNGFQISYSRRPNAVWRLLKRSLRALEKFYFKNKQQHVLKIKD